MKKLSASFLEKFLIQLIEDTRMKSASWKTLIDTTVEEWYHNWTQHCIFLNASKHDRLTKTAFVDAVLSYWGPGKRTIEGDTVITLSVKEAASNLIGDYKLFVHVESDMAEATVNELTYNTKSVSSSSSSSSSYTNKRKYSETI